MLKSILFIILFVVAMNSGVARADYPVETFETPFKGSVLLSPLGATGAHPHVKVRAGVVMLHGSEGGSAHLIDPEASVLASLGYQVLVYCYFDCNRGILGIPETLKAASVDQVSDAVVWLRKQNPGVKVGVYGFSRGAELTMIMGGLSASGPVAEKAAPDFLIAHTPSDTMNGPINWSWMKQSCWLCQAGIGQCADDAPESAYAWNQSCGPDDPRQIDMTKSAWIMGGSNPPAGTVIPIEAFKGPILITVGEKDEIWPVDQTRRIEAKLKAAKREATVVYFPNGGHGLQGADEFKRKSLVLEFLKKYSRRFSTSGM